MNNIAVSVVVAVYNREDKLDRCVDSLVHQSLENNEILLVDDYSTDNSWEVMEKWQERFPEKIRLFKAESKGVAYAKNTGAKAAQGDYVTFVDSDDYVDYKMLEKLYGCAEKNDFPEMVYSPIMKVSGKSLQKIATLEKHETIEDYLNSNYHYLHGKLFRADLFERFGYMPIYGQGEDISWLFPMVSNLTTIAYYNAPCYFYELSGNSICADIGNPQYVKDVIDGSEYMIRMINPDYKEHAILRAFYRVRDFSNSRPMYRDILWRYFHENLSVLEGVEDLQKKSASLYQIYNEIKEYYVEMPQNIYINGFKEIDKEAAVSKYQYVLRETPNVVILDETNCDLANCPEIVSLAFKEGDMDFVGQYFAVEACYRMGGIYIDDAVEVDHPLNVLLNDPCFFGFESDVDFTDKVFGSCPGNECFKKILRTYTCPELFDETFAPLKKRIKTVVLGMTNINMGSCILKRFDYGICLYPVDMFVYTLANTNNLSLCHYKCFDVCVPEDTISPILESLWKRNTRIEVGKQNVAGIKKDRDFLKKRCTGLESKVKTLEKDKAYFKNKSVSVEGKVAGLEKDRTFLKKKSANLETKVTGLEKDRAFLKDKSANLERKVDSLEKDRAFLKGKSMGLEDRLQDSVENRAFLEKDIVRLENKMEGLMEDRVFLKDKASRLEKKVESLQSERAELEKKVAELETQLGEFWRSKIARAGRKLSQKIGK